MTKLRRIIASFLPFLLLLTFLTGYANAALQAVGPTDPVTTIPTYYQDPTNLALQPCLDQNGFCILTPNFDPAADPLTRTPPGAGLSPITTTGPIDSTNFPDESFYFIADATITTPSGAKLVYRAAMEAAFLAGVAPNTGITFLRINMKKASGLTPNSTYTVTHPYGTFTVSTDNIGDLIVTGAGQAFRTEDPATPAIGVYFPPEMQGAVTTHVGPFLVGTAGIITDPGTGNQYVGNPGVATTVTGSPFNTNFFRVEGPNINPGAPNPNRIETALFNIAGRVFTGTIASPMTIDRATYARDAATGQVDIFVTALPAATLSVSGTGITSANMTQDLPNTGKFFAQFPFTTTLPSALSITNSLDIPNPIPHPIVLVDEVSISQAYYNPVAKTLTIKAASRDRVALPTLTVPQFAAPNTLDATGTLVVSLATTIPPLDVHVQSSRGGEAIAPVSVVIPPAPPVAVDDATTTPFDSAVVIGVLANDTTAGTLDPATVVTAAAVGGTAVANSNGTVTFTPTTGFSGGASFTYTVQDTFGQVSNAATVTVTVAAPPSLTITSTAGPNGSISPAGVTTVLSGANQTYAITPDAGFQVANLVVDGLTLPAAASYTFTSITGNHTISASFVPNFTITAAAGPNGAITPAGALTVTSGSNQTYIITPNPGFTVAALVVDGTTLPGATSHTFTNVTASHYINAYFDAIPTTSFTINASAGPNGAISPAGATTVTGGTNQTYTITPNQGFTVVALVVDGVVLPGATSHTFTSVIGDHYINAYFDAAPATVTIAAAAAPNGTISPAGANVVAGGTDQTFTITPNAGFMVSALVVDGAVFPGATSYTFTNLSADHYINAYFDAVPATVTITAAAAPNGTISPAGANIVAGGSNQTFTITPNVGFTVAALVVDGAVLPGATSYTFTNVSADHYINAYFQ